MSAIPQDFLFKDIPPPLTVLCYFAIYFWHNERQDQRETDRSLGHIDLILYGRLKISAFSFIFLFIPNN